MKRILPFYAVLCLATRCFASDEVIAWGKDASGESSPWSNLSGVVAIAAGYHHSLALRTNGVVVGWGNDDWGQASGSSINGQIGIAAENSYSLSFGSSGFVQAWGDNSSGQVSVPGNLQNVVALAAGGSFALALRADGSVASWGDIRTSRRD